MHTQRILTAVLILMAGSLHAATHFADSFDRADSLDIDAVATGMAGPAAPMSYSETDGIVGNDSLTRILGNTLRMAYGPNASVVGLTSYNFTNDAILAEGGFSISMNTANHGGATDNDRWCGFGVGLSAAEIGALNLDFNSNNGPRGRFDGSTTGVADFFVGWSPGGGGSIQIFSSQTTGGTAYPVFDLDGGLLQADFFFSGFSSGEAVSVVVYFDGAEIVRTNFSWGGTLENYVALSSRQDTLGMAVDDLLLASPINPPPEPWFADTFDRTADFDIDATTNGMSGVLAPVSYREVEESPGMTQVTNNTLHLAYGPNASVVGLSSHNFTNTMILTNSGFSLSMDIQDLGTDSDVDRFCGFGVGLSSNEIAALDLDFDSSNGPRGTFSGSHPGVADFYVCWTPNNGGDLQIFSADTSGGQQLPVSAASGGRLQADFFFDSFDQDDAVDVVVYLNGSRITTTRFNWNGSNDNFLALSARQSDGMVVDNLVVSRPIGERPVTDFSDSFQVLKNSTSNTLDVLMNDQGAGLSLVSIGSPTNGSAFISGSNVVYTPGAGFVGLDAFSYTTVDTTPETNTWNVTVDVRAHPNFVLLYTDDEGWTSLSTMTDTNRPYSMSDYHITPNIARLADEGLRFSRGYSPHPNCSPSRYAIQTGKTCTHLGFTDIVGRNNNPSPNTGYLLISPGKTVTEIQAAETTIAEQLKSIPGAGYTAAHFGKWHLNGGGPGSHGYDASDGATGNGEGNEGPANTPVADPKKIYSVTGRSMTWMQATVESRSPFYLQVSHYAVHAEIQFSQESHDVYAGVPLGTRHNSRNYAAMITDLDTGIGQVLAKIDELGIRNSTYVIYQADNGAPADLSDNTPLRGNKPEQWEGGTRVPTFVRGPGIAPGTQCDVPVIGIDILPTIWEWATGSTTGLPPTVDGGSWVETIRQVSAGQQPAPMIDRPGEMVIYMPHYVITADPKDCRPRAVIHDGDYKLVVQFELGTIELYNLDQRIEEDTDIGGIAVGKKWELWLRLRDYMKAQNALYALPDADNWPGGGGVQDNDVDNDGLPDDWEARELLTFALDGSVDTDQDGYTNAEEEANGTDPLLPEAITIDPDLLATNGVMRVSWTGVPGETYLVETTTNLLSGVWTLEQIVETGDGFQVQAEIPTLEAHAFFRVRRQ